VAETEARQRSRRLRLSFLRNRIVRLAMVILPIVGVTVWVLWAYTGLPPDPPGPSTNIGDATASGDWPQAGGGVTNSGAAAGTTFAVDAAPKPLWRYVAGSPITATPAVVGDRVYLTAEDGSVVSLERETGRLVWRYDAGLTAGVTPAVTDGLVFVVFRPGVVSALEAETGEVVWSRRLRTASLPSPTVADGRLFVAETDKNRIVALDATTGERLWDYRLSGWVIAPPAVIDGKVIITANDAKVHVIDGETGKLRMIYDAGSSRWVRGGPVATDDLLHFSSFGGRVWGVDYQGHRYPLERQILYVRTILWVWGYTKQGPVQQGHVWSSQTYGDQPYTPALSDTTAVVADAAGIVTGLDTATGDVLWETDLDTDVTVAPTTAGPVALIGDEHGSITGLWVADGSRIWVAALEGAVTASPIAVGTLLLAASTDNGGTLTAFTPSSN
jgi:outer membrane protein assembly factor BamB